MADNKDSGYPKSNGPLYKSPIEEAETYWIGNTSYRRSSSYKTLTPEDHMGIKGYQPIQNSKPEFLIKNANEHFTRDVNTPGEENYPVKITTEDGREMMSEKSSVIQMHYHHYLHYIHFYTVMQRKL